MGDERPAAVAPEQDDDATLFREAMRDVRPLKPSDRSVPPRRRPRGGIRARRAHAEHRAVLRESAQNPAAARAPGGASGHGNSDGIDLYELQPGDELLFRRGGISEAVLRRLRRGQYRVEAELDLHGCTLAQALPQLQAFLRAARSRGLHCVRIIHGKGLRSGNRGPVLKNSVNAQLRRADAVLAFASARPAAGGTGATLVLLARA